MVLTVKSDRNVLFKITFHIVFTVLITSLALFFQIYVETQGSNYHLFFSPHSVHAI